MAVGKRQECSNITQSQGQRLFYFSKNAAFWLIRWISSLSGRWKKEMRTRFDHWFLSLQCKFKIKIYQVYRFLQVLCKMVIQFLSEHFNFYRADLHANSCKWRMSLGLFKIYSIEKCPIRMAFVRCFCKKLSG